MQKVYYNQMKNARVLGLIVSLPFAVSALASEVSYLPERQSTSKPITAAALDSHEGLTVAADPWLTADRYKQTFPKKTPYQEGVVAIKVTFRNDSDESIKIGIERIRLNLTFDETNRQELPALTSEELADAVLHPKLKGPSRARLPIPLPSSPGGRDKKWQEYQKLAEEAGLHAAVVPPHGAVQGLLYFDLQSQFDLLHNARLYIPDLTALETNRNLMYFDIDLGRPTTK